MVLIKVFLQVYAALWQIIIRYLRIHVSLKKTQSFITLAFEKKNLRLLFQNSFKVPLNEFEHLSKYLGLPLLAQPAIKSQE